MPIERCQREGKPGYRWGSSGHCYTYTVGNQGSQEMAERKAKKQGRAIKWRQNLGASREWLYRVFGGGSQPEHGLTPTREVRWPEGRGRWGQAPKEGDDG